MYSRYFKAFLTNFLFVIFISSSAFALLSENDKQLNKNIKNFAPVYCSIRRIPLEYWGRKYEFIISLKNDEKLSLAPSSDLSNEFLGYKNKNTKLNILCNKLDPVFGRLVSSKLIQSFDIDDCSYKITYLIEDLGPPKKVEITLSIARDVHNIEILESRANLMFFKKYKSARIFNVFFNVKDVQSDTFYTFSRDPICYNLK